jgi:hypothetical protein
VADATGAWLARKRSAARQLFEIWTRPSAAEIYVAGHGGAGYFFFRVISWLHAVFVEFCSETQSQAITALFLVQISCSCGDENLNAQNFQTVSALVAT